MSWDNVCVSSALFPLLLLSEGSILFVVGRLMNVVDPLRTVPFNEGCQLSRILYGVRIINTGQSGLDHLDGTPLLGGLM